MATILDKQGLYGRVHIWQDDALDSTAWSKLRIQWRNPEGRLIVVDSDCFKRLPIEQLRAIFNEAVALIESSEWSDEQNRLYIEKLELEILERKRKIQLAKIVHNMGETA
ncbi:hypothetical protein [Lactococcus sp. DD01]|uniref:hypothetical protein n=1 Tax=Lactococcus sp. DD01 TaxID=1776443 RepID=UPI0007768753|nr:hypothetical protein [Lactococcus sp. DD01]KXT63196.1 hypothetical protein LACDD01_00140 [Lactococcus sp. DD01]